MDLAARMKAARTALGLKQDEIAAQSGVSYSVYQKYEMGRSVPGGEAIAGLVRLGINANWLLTDEGPMLIADLASHGPLDAARLKLALETVEEGLHQTNRTMAPDKRAELVLAVYDLYADDVSTQTQERILRLVKSAG